MGSLKKQESAVNQGSCSELGPGVENMLPTVAKGSQPVEEGGEHQGQACFLCRYFITPEENKKLSKMIVKQ